MDNGGYFFVHRKIVESDVFEDAWILKLFIWCLARARWKNKEKGHDLEPGQFWTTREIGSESLKVSGSKWYRGMLRLQEMQTITLKANNAKTLVTICNYKSYQNVTTEERTTDEQRMNNERTTILIEEEGKKEKKGTLLPEIEMPAPLDTPVFCRLWDEWISYRRECRLSMRPATLRRQLEFLNGLGLEAAMESIETSMRSGWKGLFPPKGSAPKKITLTEAVMEGYDWAAERDEQDRRNGL